jgi:hypothetical protein
MPATLIAAVACVLLVAVGCNHPNARLGNLLACVGSAGIVLLVLL